MAGKGNPKGVGRPKGVPNKTTQDIRSAIHEAFERAGGVDYLVRLASTDPKTFIPLLAKIVPAEIRAQVEAQLTVVSGVPRKDGA